MTGDVRVVDACLRDGMHAVNHRLTPAQMASIAAALDAAGVDTLEVGHGDGLGGSARYGPAGATDKEYLQAVAAVLVRSRLAVLALPGIATVADLDVAVEYGACVLRVGTYVAESASAAPYIRLAKQRGMQVTAVFMLAHQAPIAILVGNARRMVDDGADGICLADSAGYMLPHEVGERVAALRTSLGCPIGFHAHNNLGLALGNSLAALEAGAQELDGSLRGFGAGAGNAPTEVLVAVLDRMGLQSGIDLLRILDAARLVDPIRAGLKNPSEALLLSGYLGMPASLWPHAERAAEQFGLDPRELLLAAGQRQIVIGQEDVFLDVARELAGRK